MLQALRGGAKSPIMKVFLVFLAGGFALWGVGDMTTGLIGGSDKAISAGDESLSPREVAMEFDRARRSYLPNATVGEAMQSGLLSEVTGGSRPRRGVPRRGRGARDRGHARHAALRGGERAVL